MQVLVFGSSGQLASALATLPPSDLEFTFLDRNQCDLTYKHAIRERIIHLRPEVVVNAAAYTAVDKAESEEALAFQVNADAPEAMAQACAEFGIAFIHISTDYVFDGTASTPYTVDVAVNPLGCYGASKFAGEQRALAAHSSTVVIRTSWVYGDEGGNFVSTMLRLAETRDELGIVADQWGRPTYVNDLAKAIMDLIPQLNDQHGGVYHYSNEGEPITWYDFAKEVFQLSGKAIELNRLSTEQYPTPAKRPKWSVLDCAKIKETFQLRIPGWKESLKCSMQNRKIG